MRIANYCWKCDCVTKHSFYQIVLFISFLLVGNNSKGQIYRVPEEIISPVCGVFNFSAQKSDEWHFWKYYCAPGESFCFHRVGGGISGADDTEAWDFNYGLARNDDEGLPVYAVETGYIEYWGNGSSGELLIKHISEDGSIWYSGYLHMKNIHQKSGKVFKGQKIGEVSNVSSYSISPHLHFAVYIRNEANVLVSVDVNFIQNNNQLVLSNTSWAKPFVKDCLDKGLFSFGDGCGINGDPFFTRRKMIIASYRMALDLDRVEPYIPISERNTYFNDVSDQDTDLFTAVWSMWKKGYIKGNQNFRPFDNVSRGEVAKLIVTASGINTTEYSDKDYPDVIENGDGKEFYEFINILSNNDAYFDDGNGSKLHRLVSGYYDEQLDNIIFGPNYWITGNEIAKMLALTYAFKNENTPTSNIKTEGGLYETPYDPDAVTPGILSPPIKTEYQVGEIVQLAYDTPLSSQSNYWQFDGGQGEFAILSNDKNHNSMTLSGLSAGEVNITAIAQNGGRIKESNFTIRFNEPIDFGLSSNQIEENNSVGSEVGTFNVIDPDPDDTYSFAFAEGNGDNDNSSFQISGNTLATLETFDFESKVSYSIRVKVTGSNGGFREKPFNIYVTDQSDSPPVGNVTNYLPANNSKGVSVAQTVMDWSDVEGALYYNLEVSEYSDFSPLTASQNPQQSSAVLTTLKPDKTYYYRVKAMNAYGETPYSQAFSFSTEGKALTITNPTNGQELIQGSKQNFDWTFATNDDEFTLELLNSSNSLIGTWQTIGNNRIIDIDESWTPGNYTMKVFKTGGVIGSVSFSIINPPSDYITINYPNAATVHDASQQILLQWSNLTTPSVEEYIHFKLMIEETEIFYDDRHDNTNISNSSLYPIYYPFNKITPFVSHNNYYVIAFRYGNEYAESERFSIINPDNYPDIRGVIDSTNPFFFVQDEYTGDINYSIKSYNGDARYFNNAFYLSKDQILDDSDVLLSIEKFTHHISPDESIDSKINLLIPEDAPTGIGNILMVSDVYDDIPETDENNVEVYADILVSAPALKVKSISGDLPFAKGNPINVVLNKNINDSLFFDLKKGDVFVQRLHYSSKNLSQDYFSSADWVYRFGIPDVFPGEYKIEVSSEKRAGLKASTSNFNVSSSCWGCASLIANRGIISDGSETDDYSINRLCDWVIRNKENHYVDISFDLFDLANDGDKVIVSNIENGIYVDPPLAVFTYNNEPTQEIISYADSVNIRFVTDESGNADGWELTYEVKEASKTLEAIISEVPPTEVGKRSLLTLSLMNSGNLPVTVDSLIFSRYTFYGNYDGAIASGEDVKVPLYFSPITYDYRETNKNILTVVSNATETLTVELDGKGLINQTDSLIMVSFYQSTGGDEDWKTKWDVSRSMSEWEGITLRGYNKNGLLNNGRVFKVELEGNNLTGGIPASIYQLEELEVLSFYSNNLTGEISNVISNLTQLEKLDLGMNGFSGKVPDNLSELPKLNVLYLDDNNFIGAIPEAFANIPFETLYLNGNHFNNLPTFKSEILPSNADIKVEHNRFGFADLVSNVALMNSIKSFTYSPQFVDDTLFIQASFGQFVKLSVSERYPNTQYQWYKDGLSIIGADDSVFQVEFIETASGTYTCELTNPAVPGLTVKRLPIVLKKRDPQDITWDGLSWSLPTGPTKDDNVIIAGDYSSSLDNNRGILQCQDMTINEGVSCIFDNESTLDVYGNIINAGILTIESGSSLLTYSGGSVSNNVVINRTTRYADGKYSFVGSPMQTNQEIIGNTLGTIVYQYNEQSPYGNDGLTRWENAKSEVLIPGRGYAQAGQKELSFTGIPNSGSIIYTGTNTNDTNNQNVGWNLVSNPYSASINVTEFLQDNTNLDANYTAVYIWDDNGSNQKRGSNSDYIVANTSGATDNNPSNGNNSSRFNGYLGSSQGFFVKLNGQGNNDIVFEEDQRIAGFNSDNNFFRIADQKQEIRINLTTSEGLFKQTLVVWNEMVTDKQINPLYDASIFGDISDMIYSIKLGNKLAIQTINSSVESLNLGFKVSESGDYTLEIDTSSYFGEVSIMDLYRNKEVNSPYEFEADSGEIGNRFQIIFNPKSILSSSESNGWKIYSYQHALYFRTPEKNNIIRKFEIYDLSGQLKQSLLIGHSQKVDISYLSTGVYVLTDGKNALKFIVE